jgi:hypothetical protein
MAALQNMSPDIGVSAKNLMITSSVAQCHVLRARTPNGCRAENRGRFCRELPFVADCFERLRRYIPSDIA